jgi:hypothetical protein
MDTDRIHDILSSNLPEFRAMGVRTLAIFGSAARDATQDDSDVDILVEFEDRPTFDGFMDLNFRLEQLLGRRVDLVTLGALKHSMRDDVLREARYVA